MNKFNHLISACIVACVSHISLAQNTWDGSTTSTITTNGNIGIGATPSGYRFSLNNTTGTVYSGMYNTVSLADVTTTQYGMRNVFNLGGNSFKYGIHNTVTVNSTGSSYGVLNTITGSGTGNRFGLYSTVSGTGTGPSYGIFSSVTNSATTKYGIYTSVSNTGSNNSSTTPTIFGLYSIASGADSRAAYFQGDLETYQGNAIFASANGSRFMIYNHSTANDNTMSIVLNQTNNQYDWDWTKSLMLNRAGEMIKRINNTGKVFSISRFDLNQDVFRIYGDGKVFATEVNVMLASSFPDYVFKSDYKLMPLNEVNSYIKSNGHLPNVPAAAEVEKDGINVGQMTTILLEKVEELTLYLLEQQSLIKQQQAEIEALKVDLKKLNK